MRASARRASAVTLRFLLPLFTIKAPPRLPIERTARGATRRNPASRGGTGRPGAFGINTALTWSKDRVRLGVGDLGWFTRAAAGPEGVRSGFGRGRR